MSYQNIRDWKPTDWKYHVNIIIIAVPFKCSKKKTKKNRALLNRLFKKKAKIITM